MAKRGLRGSMVVVEASADPRWRPRRRGAVFCSPGCGGEQRSGCTWAAYGRAVDDGCVLAIRLDYAVGPGWTVRVWENLGWHFCAVSPCGRIKVHVSNRVPRTYTAYLGEPGFPGGRWVESDDSALGAVEAVLAAARRDLNKINAILRGLEWVRGVR